MNCSNCQTSNKADANYCQGCGQKLFAIEKVDAEVVVPSISYNNQDLSKLPSHQNQPVIIIHQNNPQPSVEQQQKKGTNGFGIAGFIFALIALLMLLPLDDSDLYNDDIFLGLIFWWVLGLIFSIIGVTKKPKGLSITGLIFSGLVFLILLGIAAS